MNITADTNLLVRAITGDHAEQSAAAQRVLAQADLIAVPDTVLCELCWVLARLYKFAALDIARAIRVLASAQNVACDRSGIEAGLAMLDAGGDFADGVIAHGGQWLGGETFVSFDPAAVDLLRRQGLKAMLPQ